MDHFINRSLSYLSSSTTTSSSLDVSPAGRQMALADQDGDGTMTTTNQTSAAAAQHEEDILEMADEIHTYDAEASLLLNALLIVCFLLAYYVKKFRVYYLPESAGALLVGIVVGAVITIFSNVTDTQLQPFEFSPELFFFVLLPPIIFEAGYALNRKDFFLNMGAIWLYAMVGTIISTFVVGYGMFLFAKIGLIGNIDTTNSMEPLLFGALISAVDPVATLSIMGNAELGCDPLVYSLVFGESVLNDAIAISLFKVFAKYYEQSVAALAAAEEAAEDGTSSSSTASSGSSSQIPAALLSFIVVSLTSIMVGIGLGLLASAMYRHTQLKRYPRLETSLLFSFCYLCYATAESMGLSGIMALFFQGMVLSHYNSYNLSPTAHVASEEIFSTLANIAETAVFLYMGMGVFTGRFKNYDIMFSITAMFLCVLGRLCNIFPLSALANLCRHTKENRITSKMQFVLWFAGLRGAIAFALAMNMPGPNREVYTTATLSICIFTTVVCGGLTEHMLTRFGMKRDIVDPATVDDSNNSENDDSDNNLDGLMLDEFNDADDIGTDTGGGSPSRPDNEYHMVFGRRSSHVYKGAKRLWRQFDNDVLRVYFGGPETATNTTSVTPSRGGGQRPGQPSPAKGVHRQRRQLLTEDHLGHYELGVQHNHSEGAEEDGDENGIIDTKDDGGIPNSSKSSSNGKTKKTRFGDGY